MSGSILAFLLWLFTFLIVDSCICRASSEAACIPSERHALLQLKHHLLDPSNRLASWSSHGDCCKWTSVVCSNVTGNVLQLHLATFVPNYDDDLYGIYVVYMGSRFGGELHSSILDLKHLDYLDLSGNYFGEIQIPSFLGSMTSLTYLNLSRAGFGGSIPFQIGNLSNLLYLDLGSNNFDGSIPFQIGNLSNLLYLGLQGSYLEPSFAENLQWLSPLSSLQYLKLNYVNLSIAFDWLHVLHSLPSLTELHLSDCVLPHYYQPSTINFSSLENLDISDSNNFAASMIPKWMFELKKLIYLVLKGNQLQGSIPDGIQNLTLLQHLDLSYNSFNSSIPNWLYSFTSLNFLDLGSNMLHGTISNAIGNLTSLITLDLSGNELEGKIPKSMKNLCNLRNVYFSTIKCNQQVHEILEIFSSCISGTLETLHIINSLLFGNLTDQIGLFKNLVSLDLSYNSVQGPIPVSLINLTSLKYLALSKNQFIGNPFEVLGSLSELQKLSIDDNHFHGVVKEAHLSDFPRLLYFFASKNQLTLNVGSNWRPSFQFLMELEMASWHLGPTFPSWLQSLKNLWSLDISKSRISGSIPNWFWGTFMNSIFGGFYVDLSWNNLSGELPYLSLDVFHLDLSNNHFSGSITHLLCTEQDKPKILEFLNLASNNLSGEIPDCWMMWPYLVTLKLEHNNFTGNLPTSMGSLAFLDMLHLRNNRFSGKFPAILRSNRKLISLDLGENQFSGVIPSWVGQSLFNLKILRLASNKFSGSIPHQICDMSLLHILDLSQNNLTGNIPKCVNHLNAMLVINTSSNSYILSRGNQSSSIVDVLLLLKGRVDVYSSILGLVTSIDLSGNKLSGRIPSEITNLKGLRFLNLSNNLLSGQIPQTIGDMGSVESMDFSRNHLSGEIPPSMSKLSFLALLNLSYNNLKGKFPTATQLQSFEASSFVGNDLCGPPLAIDCITNGVDHNEKEADDESTGINWFYVSMALGFVVGFWGVIGPLLYNRSWRHAYFGFIDDLWFKIRYCYW